MSIMMNEEQVKVLFGDKEARDLQIIVRNQTAAALIEGHKRILVIMPTGSGKTITSGLILIDEGIRETLKVPVGRQIVCWFLCHRQRLLSQAEMAYAAEESIKIITVSTSGEIPTDHVPDIIIYDEAHHEATLSVQLRLEKITVAPMIGFTANEVDARGDGRLCKFSKIIQPMTRAEAVKAGYLAESHIYSFIDSSRSLVDIGVDMILECHTIMGQTMPFLKTKKEVIEFDLRLKKLGFKSQALIDLSEKELNYQLARFENKEFQYGPSCMKLGEGVDVKGCESMQNLRKLRSRGLLNQFIGRASRNDSPCRIFEAIDPLTTNLDATSIVGVPKEHNIFYKVRGEWRKHELIAA